MKRLVALGAVALAGALAGCGGATPTPPTTAPTSAAPTPTPSPSETLAPLTDREVAWLASYGYGPDDPEGREQLPKGHAACDGLKSSGATVVANYDWGSTRENMIRAANLLCDLPADVAAVIKTMETPGAWSTGTHPVGSGEGEVSPGVYAAVEATDECSWIRSPADGEEIESDDWAAEWVFVAKDDATIEADGCGIWTPVELTKKEHAYLEALGGDVSEYDLEEGHEQCASLNEYDSDTARARSLVESAVFARDLAAPKVLCPEFRDAAKLASRGFDDGDYAVGKGKGDVRPGTYRTGKGARDCYWERVTGGGRPIANDFVTHAPKGVTVTVRSSDGGFSSSNCGVWLPVEES